MMGYGNRQMTVDIYVHLLPDQDKSAMNILGNIGTPTAPRKNESTVTNQDHSAFMSNGAKARDE